MRIADLRDATSADAAAIAAIWNPIVRDTVATFWPTPRPDTEIIAMIGDRRDQGHPFILAEISGRVVGFATYGQFRAGKGYSRSMEHTIYLDPGVRGGGIGSLLLSALEERACAAGHRILIGAVTASNQGSLRFHQNHGYREWGRIPGAGWKFGEFHDLVLMGKTLAS